MQGKRAGGLRGRTGLILFVVAAAAAWWVLSHAERRADWLRVEAPRRAVMGQPLPMRVHLAPQAGTGYLCADLHWGTSRDVSKGFLATGGARAAGAEGGTFDFEIMVPSREGLRFVTGILFLSRTGAWQDHTRVAATEVIPVSSDAGDKAESRLEPMRLQPLGDDSGEQPRPAALPQWLTALLFLAAAVAAWRAGQANRGWRVLAVALALACLWELPGLESWIGAHARAMARAGDFYYPRAVFQKVVITAAIAATAVFLIRVRGARRPWRLLLASFGVYAVISVVNLVSLHVIDKIAGLSWHGLTVVQTLKLVCAAITLRGVVTACRRHSGAGV